MDKLLTTIERRNLQLEMLDEIHKVCVDNGIRYSLSCGTLLGAIRHGGFIPWDDDVDIMMPYADVKMFKDCLKSENIRYVDAELDNYYEWFFSRVISKNTYTKPGKFLKGHGVFIDLYPVVRIPNNDNEIDSFLEEGDALKNICFNALKWRRRLSRFFSLPSYPGYRKTLYHLTKHIYQFAAVDSNTYFVTSGSFNKINVFKRDLFEDIITIKFEDRLYNICSCYDYYLSHVYGDYMTPPPENQRIPYHGGRYYWK